MCSVSDTTARTGGGTMPKSEIPSVAVSIRPDGVSLNTLSRKLRIGTPAVVGVVENEQLHLDLRTVFPHQDQDIKKALSVALSA
jgi:L-seryl-tRNA(Ser) seleniumtransferase